MRQKVKKKNSCNKINLKIELMNKPLFFFRTAKNISLIHNIKAKLFEKICLFVSLFKR